MNFGEIRLNNQMAMISDDVLFKNVLILNYFEKKIILCKDLEERVLIGKR